MLPKSGGPPQSFRLRAAPPVIWQPTRPLRPFLLFRREDLHIIRPRGGCPERRLEEGTFRPGEGSAVARSSIAAGRGLASRQGAAAFPFKRAGGAGTGVRLLLWEARKGKCCQRPTGPSGPSVAGSGPSCHLTAHPTSAPVVPLPPGRGATRCPCGRDASAPWWGQGEMGLPPDALPKPRRGLLHAPRRFGSPLKIRLLWHSFAAISAK